MSKNKVHTAKDTTDLLQVVNFTSLLVLQQTCQFHQVATNLSIASSRNKSVKIRLIKTTCRKPVDNKFRQLICNKFVENF